MTNKMRKKLIELAKENISSINDPSHDILHTLRVLANAEKISEEVEVDLDVVVPAALFHDLVVYPKDSPKTKDSVIDSSKLAGRLLLDLPEFPNDKIEKVKEAILSATFNHGTKKNSLEAIVVHDADLLEATGLVGAMRTFGSCGSMNRPFYHGEDPFGKNREYEETKYGLDHFYQRLLIAKDRISTEPAKRVAERRTKVLEEFLTELEVELSGE